MVTRPIFHPILLVAVLAAALAVVVWRTVRAAIPAGAKVGTIARMSAVSILALAMGMRPMLPNGKMATEALDVDCLIVVDTTLSMWAADYGGARTRMDGAKEICSHMVDMMGGASFAIVTFDHLARVLAPFTEDQQCIDDAIDVIMQPTEGYAHGSSLSAPHDRMAKMLESAAKRSGRTRVVVFVSDGEITDGSERGSYADLADLSDDALVVGLGTERGGTMAYEGGWGAGRVQDPETGADAISRIDEGNLRGIADDLGGTYVHAERAGDVDGFIQGLRDRSHKVSSEQEELALYDDIYWVFAIPLGALLLWQAVSLVMRRRI